jgi:hypothetical protein
LLAAGPVYRVMQALRLVSEHNHLGLHLFYPRRDTIEFLFVFFVAGADSRRDEKHQKKKTSDFEWRLYAHNNPPSQ